MNENIYRWMAIAIFVAGAGISAYHRQKAERAGGEKIGSRVEGWVIRTGLRFFGFALWLGVFTYMINPDWMTWSQFQAPAWFRLTGAGIGVIADLLSFWVFTHLGNNVTQTILTRKDHKLVTDGPYRWVRHPLYTMGMAAYLSFSMLASNWYIAALAVTTFLILSRRVPGEEARLIERFGNEYRNYMKRTGKYLPRLGMWL